jgi:predicted Zn-dependent peptidase
MLNEIRSRGELRALLLFAVLLSAAVGARAQNEADFGKQVTEFSLPNGLHWIVLERHETPLVSFHIYVRAGVADIPGGQSGLGRLMEREAWDGTEIIGSRDAAAEKKAAAALEEAYDRLETERNKGPKANDGTVIALGAHYRLALDRAQSYGNPQEYSRKLLSEGATGLTATAGADSMEYACTLPSNRVELWFSMESQRLAHPVFRSFYAERDRLADELRSPARGKEESRLMEELAAAAFAAHPYRNPLNGWPGDVDHLRPADANAFAARDFVPGNITIALAGDVKAAEARRLAEKYFGAMGGRAMPAPVHTEEPAQTGPKTVIASGTSTPMVAIGYKRPDQLDRDDTVFELIQLILASGPDSWLGKELRQEKKLILSARVEATFPGGRYPNLFALVLVPAAGRTLDEVEAAWAAVLASLQNRPVDEAVLARAKAQARAGVLQHMEENAGAARILASALANYGDWQAVFRELDAVNGVTALDVQRVAVKYLVAAHRTMAYSGLTGPGTPVPQPGTQK